MMKRLLLIGLLFCFSAPLIFAQPNLQYSRVKIRLAQHTLPEIGALGLETDHGYVVPGRFIINDYSEDEIALLAANDVPYEILIEDVKQWYVEQNNNPQNVSFRNDCESDEGYDEYETPENYEMGTMGGYFTYDEMLENLDNMLAQYPNLISERQQIGDILTHEGRPVYWLRVSDNPNTDETTEPEVLYTAVHHAREPNSLSQVIFYLWYLLENYETDPEVRFLIDNTELYFIPCINPDGYIYNQTTNPDGGGLWRKNRWTSEEDDITYGVDLNRNYGYEWGADNNGSSPNPNSQVFRGPGPFSEPETQAVKYLCEQHEFQIALNYHTYGNLLIHPWGYNDTPTAEDELFKGMGEVMTRENNFTIGTGSETVGYVVNGNSDDWMYGETETKNLIYSMTPEVGPGSFGFWPGSGDIDELNKSAMWLNLATAHLVHNYLEVKSTEEGIISAIEGNGTLELKRYGLAPGSNTVSVVAGSSNLSITPNEQEYNLETLDTDIHEYEYVVTPDDNNVVEEVLFVIQVDNGTFIRTDTLKRNYINSIPDVVVTDNLDNADQWFTSELWGLTESDFVSAPTSMTDSPNGDYPNGVQNTISTLTPIILTEGERAFLKFWARWEIEEGYDYAQVLISTDGGFNYEPLCGKYTKPGVGGFQPFGEPLYDGIQSEWVYEEIDISNYIGSDAVYIRFYFASDNFVNLDGFYFDDLEVNVLTEPISSTEAPSNSLQFLDVRPNPFQNQLFTDFVINQPAQQVEVRLTSSLGEVLTQKQLQGVTTGHKHQIALDTHELPQGVYLVQLIVDGKLVNTEKVVKVN